MEFRFDLNEIFNEPIVELGNSLLPPGFTGDKRTLWDTQSKVTQIVNAMGEASASAQGLSKPITTADRLRNSEHKLYLLVDSSANNGKGAVTGMLKTGEKGLYVFDREGQHYKVSPPCVLDFYVHESRQRSGYGKTLFEHMLQKQQLEPVKLAVDRPSDKLLGFLNKHYGLNNPVKQMNNYVVYDGFFPKSSETPRAVDGDKSYTPGKKQSANGLQHGITLSPYGRYGAPRPPCSMGQIIHNDSAVIKRNQEATGRVRSEPITNVQGQRNMYNSSPMPAWQATQSVPNNMSYAYSQNQQNYAQNPQQSAFNQQCPQNPQFAQYQQFAQNQNDSYPPSSGDHAVNVATQQMGLPVEQNQVAVAQGQNLGQYDQNAAQNYQQIYNNYTMGQGDATGQSYKDQNLIASTGQQIQGQNVNRHPQISNPNEFLAPQPVAQNDNLGQGQPQIISYQGQTYCLNPQTQQYQIISNQNQQSLKYNSPQFSYNPMPEQSDAGNFRQGIQETSYSQKIAPQQQKEPLRPQNLDGTVRRVQQTLQSVSVPVQKIQTRENQNLPIIVQQTASAPIIYHQSTLNSYSKHTEPDYAQNTAAISQILNKNESETPHQIINQITSQSQCQPNIQIQLPTPAILNLPHVGDQTFDIDGSASIEKTGQVSQNTLQHAVHTPQINTNANHLLENQVTHQHIENVQRAPSILQVTANVRNTRIPQQQNISFHNQTNTTPQNQPTSHMPNISQGGNQNLNILPSSIVKNLTHQTQSTNLRTRNIISQKEITLNFPSTNQIVTQPTAVNQLLNNQMVMQNQQGQNILQRSGMSQAQNLPLQQQQHVMYQHQPMGHQAEDFGTQRTEMNINQNRNDIVPHSNENRGFGQDGSRFLQSEGSAIHSSPNIKCDVLQEPRHVQQDIECDLSKGYPPQHHEKQAQNSTPKADRPQSLNIEIAENLGNSQTKANAEIHEELLDGGHEDNDSLDGDPAALEEIEDEIEKIEVAPKEGTPVSKGSKSPGMEAAGIVTPGRNTPGLTDQGYFDLKFYHNKLW